MRQQHVQLRVHGTRLNGGRAGLHAGGCPRFARRADRNLSPLGKLYPERLGAKALMGYSMGAFESLFVAATESTNEAPLDQV
jgi:hypothetical protein